MESPTKLDANYQEIKPKPARRLEKFCNYLVQKQNHTGVIIEEFRLLISSRSMKIPVVVEEEIIAAATKTDQTLPATNAAASEMLVEIIKEMQSIYESVQRSRLIKQIGSILPWLSGLVPGAVVGYLAWLAIPGNIWVALGIGIVLAFAIPVALMVVMLARAKQFISAPYQNLLIGNKR